MVERTSRTVGDKVYSQKGKSPDQKLRSLNEVKCERKLQCEDNKKVGLETAIFERKRNSSLNKRCSTEDLGG